LIAWSILNTALENDPSEPVLYKEVKACVVNVETPQQKNVCHASLCVQKEEISSSTNKSPPTGAVKAEAEGGRGGEREGETGQMIMQTKTVAGSFLSLPPSLSTSLPLYQRQQLCKPKQTLLPSLPPSLLTNSCRCSRRDKISPIMHILEALE